MKYILLATIFAAVTSCAGPLWDGNIDRVSSNDTMTVIIQIEDPLLVYILFWDTYRESELFGIIPFEEWVEENTDFYK